MSAPAHQEQIRDTVRRFAREEVAALAASDIQRLVIGRELAPGRS